MSVPVILVPSTPPVEPIAARLKEVRLQRDDFEILKVIGRGAFSEVSLEQPRWLSGAGTCVFLQWEGDVGDRPEKVMND